MRLATDMVLAYLSYVAGENVMPQISDHDSALYGVIGALSLLTTILLVILTVLFIRRRKGKWSAAVNSVGLYTRFVLIRI